MVEITAEPGWTAGAYKIYASSARVKKEWDTLVSQRPNDAQRCFERLTSEPLTHYPKRQFPLKGSNAPFWEYEVNSGDRVIYGVKNDVVVIAAGDHVKEDVGGALGKQIDRRRDAFDSYEPQKPAESETEGLEPPEESHPKAKDKTRKKKNKRGR